MKSFYVRRAGPKKLKHLLHFDATTNSQPPATAYKYTASVRLLKQRTNPSWETRAAPPAEQILTTEELMHVVSIQCQ